MCFAWFRPYIVQEPKIFNPTTRKTTQVQSTPGRCLLVISYHPRATNRTRATTADTQRPAGPTPSTASANVQARRASLALHLEPESCHLVMTLSSEPSALIEPALRPRTHAPAHMHFEPPTGRSLVFLNTRRPHPQSGHSRTTAACHHLSPSKESTQHPQ